ncbi:hypothetical protein CEXT_65591 [Caerostris extrusa]|uniref:Uncharacterized protein n=1 Tax=Caerostris extrusa TaxID=172846 RepID=A0AAV4XYI6_CAEEX|nr:hypothetical protein CEXT_65591 [Caerostris extrusa]
MYMNFIEVKSEPEDAEDAEDCSLFASRIRRRDTDADSGSDSSADSDKNTDTETFLEIQEFVTQIFPFREHYREMREEENNDKAGEMKEKEQR